MKQLLRSVREALPLLDKYLVVWDVLRDLSNADHRGAGLFFQEKYTVRRCAQFSMECLAVAVVLFIVLKWVAALLQQEQTAEFVDQLAPILQQVPLAAEFYLLGYFVVALFIGFLLDFYLAFVSRNKNRDRLVLPRFFMMYPGIFLWICLTSLTVMMLCNWVSVGTGVSMSTWSPSEIGWLKFFFGFFLIGTYAVFASSLLGAFVGWPFLLLRIAYINYGRWGVIGLVAIPALYTIISFASYEIWVRTCVSSEQTDALFGAECLIQRYYRGLETDA
ncbi:MAG: hypothetical protein ABJD13_12040 [Paracoccaceae bacterium]